MVIMLFVLTGTARAADLANIGVSTAVLRLGGGVRSGGMADVCAGVYGGLDSLYGNPAGLRVDGPEFGVRYNTLFGEVNVGSFSFANSYKFGNLGASLLYLNYGAIDKIDESGIITGSFAPFDILATVSYSRKLGADLSLGLSVKGFTEFIDSYNFGSVVLDAGALYEVISEQLCVGLLIQNIGFNINGFQLPLNIKAGAAYSVNGLLAENKSKIKVFKRGQGNISAEKTDDHLTIALDVELPSGEDPGVNAGLEYWYQDFAVRIGYKFRTGVYSSGGFTAGFGFKFAGYELNYALVPYGELGISHNFSFVFNL